MTLKNLEWDPSGRLRTLYYVSGAVIVTTPQDIALTAAEKGVNMFKLVDIPVLGLIQNMSHYHCPNCSHKQHLFGDGGGDRLALKLGNITSLCSKFHCKTIHHIKSMTISVIGLALLFLLISLKRSIQSGF